MKLCSCCESSSVHPLCGEYCENCQRPFSCFHCDRDLGQDQIESWQPGDSVNITCETCNKSEQKHLWMQETCDKVHDLASEHGWEIELVSIAETGSRYFCLFRECSSCLGVVERDCECEIINLRISDHSTAHCSEDISISMNPGGDDHSLEFLEQRLRGEWAEQNKKGAK